MKLFSWRRGEHEEFYNKINRFNRKISQAKKNGFKYDLPEKLSYKEQLNKILKTKDYTRNEFNNLIKFIDNFLNKNALDLKKGERGAKIPLWEIKDIKTKVKSINKVRNEQKKMLQDEQATDRGKNLGVKVKEIPDLATNKIADKTFNWKRMSMADFEKFKETLWEFGQSIEDKNNQMYENYYAAIDNEMDSKDAKSLKKLIDKLPQEVVIKKIYTDLNLGFKFVYSKADYDQRYTALKRAWTKIGKDYKKSLRSD